MLVFRLRDSCLDFDVFIVNVTDTYVVSINITIENSKDDGEAEMRRLKMELQRTMDLYSTACKEALTAKQKVKRVISYFLMGKDSFLICYMCSLWSSISGG